MSADTGSSHLSRIGESTGCGRRHGIRAGSLADKAPIQAMMHTDGMDKGGACDDSRLCAELQDPWAPTPYRQTYGSDAPNRVTLSLSKVSSVVDFAPLSLGHSLIAPNSHKLSSADYDEVEWVETLRIFGTLAARLVPLLETGERLIWFEHGSPVSPDRSCVEHAHIHLGISSFEVADTLAEVGLPFERFDAFERPLRCAGSTSYYAIGDGGATLVLHSDSPTVSQALRRVWGEQLGIEDALSDWAVFQNKALFYETLQIFDGVRDEVWCSNIFIDGPSGSGKTSVARSLSKTLGYSLLDTGLSFRFAALSMVMGIDPFWAVERMRIVPGEDGLSCRRLLEDSDVSARLFDPEVDELLPTVVGDALLRSSIHAHHQRSIGDASNGCVVVGRDVIARLGDQTGVAVRLDAPSEIRERRRSSERTGTDPRSEAEAIAESMYGETIDSLVDLDINTGELGVEEVSECVIAAVTANIRSRLMDCLVAANDEKRNSDERPEAIE